MDNKKEKIEKLRKLVDRFQQNFEQYKNIKYDEANTKTDFIDEFFKLLDWDVSNQKGYSEDYREVVREDKVVIKGKQKAPDYSFRIGGARKFFVEAKKPSININKNIEPAFQLRRYAYSANLPLSILTDFEEFTIYDTRIKPKVQDSAKVARIFYCNFKDYEKKFDEIYDIFSQEAINKGSFDKYVKTKKKGVSEVDGEFLELIEKWREDLAKNLALNNKNLDIKVINRAVQKIIDRIIFLRIAEDRGIEDYENLFKLVNKKNIYNFLNEYFVKAKDRKSVV